MIRKRLHARSTGCVYLAEREADGRNVVLKTYTGDSNGRYRARRELDALRSVDHPRIARALELIETREQPVLVLEHQPGITLREWTDSRPPPLLPALQVATQVAELVAHVHTRHLVHRDLTPRNILIEPESLEVRLIDFGIARPLGAATPTERAASLGTGLAGTLEYIAPEQTGRMNRGWDFRSDLYTLGATLYYLFTGRPPFEGRDPLELIHAHIARVPEDPRTHRADLPAPLSRLMMRLLQKEPEDRYPDIALAVADLVTLRDVLATTGAIPDDTRLSGLEAAAGRLAFSTRLYGREPELARLRGLYDGVRRGESRAVLLSGGPGSGKSALIESLAPTISETGGVVVSGKFDAYRNRPYAGWVAALESLTHQLLLLSNTHLRQLRSELQKGLGKVAQALVDLVPDLSFILGEVTAVPRLGPRETQERLALALTRAVRVLASPEHPLVVRLDDLEAADAGSLFLAEALLTADPPPRGLLLVGLFRQDPTHGDTPLRHWLARIADQRVPIERIEIGPLGREAANELLADALGRRVEDVRDLAAQIEVKTGNTPFLIREFVENLRAQRLLRPTPGGWEWDEAEIRGASVPEGAVELMLARIGRLEPGTVAVLRFAACVGDEFDLELLAELGCGQSEDVETALFALSNAGLIVPVRAGFRFAHDRIREAAQALLTGEAREKLHYDTGRLLLSKTPETELEGRALLLAEHLNRGRRLAPEELRNALVRVNHLAGQRAMATGGVDQASAFFGVALDLLREEDWADQRPMCLGLHLAAADCEFHRSRFAQALELLGALEVRNLSLMEQAQVGAKHILVRALTESPEEASRYAVALLRTTGVRWRLHPSRLHVWLEMWRARFALRKSRFGLAWQPAKAVDPSWFSGLLVCGAAGGISMRADARLSALFASRAICLYTKHGYVGNSGFALAVYSLAELYMGRDPGRALRAARTALVWKERSSDPLFDLRVEFVIHGLVNPWLTQRRKALAPLSLLAEQAREIGDPEFAYYAGINQNVYLALAGDPVAHVEKRLADLAEGVLRGGHRYPEAVPCHRIHALLLAEGPVQEQIEPLLEELDPLITPIPASGAVYFRTLCLQVLCVLGRYDLAFEQSEKIRADLFRVVPFLHVADHTFYRGLAAAALASRAPGRMQRTLRKVLRASARRMARWATWGPDFGHMSLLLQAERHHVRGDFARAVSLYDQAARGAQQQAFVHHAALAYERKATLLSTHRRDTESTAALRESKALYERWGCPAKSRALADVLR